MARKKKDQEEAPNEVTVDLENLDTQKNPAATPKVVEEGAASPVVASMEAEPGEDHVKTTADQSNVEALDANAQRAGVSRAPGLKQGKTKNKKR